MSGLKYQLQFERGHAMVALAFDNDLKLEVKYWPKFGTYARQDSIVMAELR